MSAAPDACRRRWFALSNPFEYFYGKSARIYRAESDGKYEPEEPRTLIGTIECDIQPMDGGLADCERGYAQRERVKLFCGAQEAIERGMIAAADGAEYVITDVRGWDAGLEIIAERRDNR